MLLCGECHEDVQTAHRSRCLNDGHERFLPNHFPFTNDAKTVHCIRCVTMLSLWVGWGWGWGGVMVSGQFSLLTQP
jgi:hypothetical protein